ncbi:MAG TPA: hypothetical protein PK819_08475 [Thermomicrobiales bacterium]|nr:hypothetical protein [Thermomicrobiales bacterium]
MTSAQGWPLIGHRSAVLRLQEVVRAERYPSAILILGAPASGRSTLARVFAQASFCPNQVNAVPCGLCPTCERIAHGTHPDVSHWSLARQTIERGANRSGTLTIETAREIGASTAFLPRDARRRFIIIEDAGTFPEVAQQAMLKALEDAPAYLTFVLIAESTSTLLETILSRCAQIQLLPVPTSEIQQALSSPQAGEIARLAMGRPGWALAAQADGGVLEEERKRITAIERWMAKTDRERLLEAYGRGEVFQRDRQMVLADLDAVLIIWRDVLLARLGARSLSIDQERASRLLVSEQPDPFLVLRAIRATERCSRDLNGNVRPRLALQAMVNQWPIL